MLAAAQDRAKKRGLEFDLDHEFIRQKILQGCEQTGLPFTLSYAGSHYGNRLPDSPSIDRIDPNKGYTKDNCQLVSWMYNVCKQRFTDSEVLAFCRKVVTYHAPVDNQMLFPYNPMDGDTASP